MHGAWEGHGEDGDGGTDHLARDAAMTTREVKRFPKESLLQARWPTTVAWMTIIPRSVKPSSGVKLANGRLSKGSGARSFVVSKCVQMNGLQG